MQKDIHKQGCVGQIKERQIPFENFAISNLIKKTNIGRIQLPQIKSTSTEDFGSITNKKNYYDL